MKGMNMKAMEMDCNSIMEVLIQKKLGKINKEIEELKAMRKWYVDYRIRIRSVRRSMKMGIKETRNIEEECGEKVRYMYTLVDELEEISHLMRFEIDSIGIGIDDLLGIKKSYIEDLKRIKAIQPLRG